MKRIWSVLLLVLAVATAHATVTNQSFSVSYTCTGSVGPFAFTFPISVPSALTVTQNGTLLPSSNYTISPVNNNYENGGSVTLNVACPASQSLVLTRVTPLTQTTLFIDNMPTPMKNFEYGLDKLTEIVQETDVVAEGKASPGACPANQFVTATTTTGVNCAPGGGGGGGGPFLPIFSGTSLSSAVTAIGGSGTLTITGQLTVPTTYSLPTTIALNILNGGSLNISSGATLNYNGGLTAGRYQIFTGSGTVNFSGSSFVSTLYPEWWGADPTGTNDSSPAINACELAARDVHGGGSVCQLTGGSYILKNTINIISAGGTGSGASLEGPDGSYGANEGPASLVWEGVNGGVMIHANGAHEITLRNITLNCTNANQAGTCVWADSDNGQSVTSESISSISRTSNVIAVTPTVDPSWAAGTNVLISGVTGDTTLNGYMTVWYSNSGTYYFSNMGSNSSGTGGTITTYLTGDMHLKMDNVTLYAASTSGTGMSTTLLSPGCGITSNVMSCTTVTPPMVTPNMWVWISGSSDPVYNAYWQVLTVTSTGFTAAATEVSSEAATVTGTVYWGTGIHFGSGQLNLAANSVCCAQITGNRFVASPYGMAAFAWSSDVGNDIDFNFTDNQTGGFRIKALNLPSGAVGFSHEVDNTIADAIYTGGSDVVLNIANTEYEGSGGQFILGNLVSGSWNAGSLGTLGQFEVQAGLASPSSVTMTGNSFGSTTWASDNVAIATTSSLTLIGNRFFASGTSAPPFIQVAQYFPGQKQEIFSTGNTYANSASWTSGGWTSTAYAPFIQPNKEPILGGTTGGTTYFLSSPVFSIGDMSSNGSGGAIASLQNAGMFTHLSQFNPSAAINAQSATTPVYGCVNNYPCVGARNAAANADDTLAWDGSDIATVGGSTAAFKAPQYYVGSNLVLPSTVTGNIGGAVKVVTGDSSGNVTLTTNITGAEILQTGGGCSSGTPYLGYDGVCRNGSTSGTGTNVNVNGGSTLATAAMTNTTGLGGITFTNPSGATVNANLAATVNGSGGGLVSGPTTSTSGDVTTFTGSVGQIQDSGTLLSSLAPKASPTFTGTATANNLTVTGTPTFSGIEGASTYCVQVSSAGVLSNTGSACGSGGGGSGFSSLTSGTNTTAAMVVGSGATLNPTGTGVVNANQVNAGTVPTSKTVVGTNSSGQLIDATSSVALANTNQINETASFTASCGSSFRLTTGSVTATLPSSITTGCVIILQNVGSGVMTITSPSVSYNGPASLCPNQSMSIQTDGSVFNGTSPPNLCTTITTIASTQMAGVNSLYLNQDATAATNTTYTLVASPQPGMTECAKNSYNGSAANTGQVEITVSNPGSQKMIYNGTVAASGYVQSTGSAGDGGCAVAISTTAWEFYPSAGSWATH